MASASNAEGLRWLRQGIWPTFRCPSCGETCEGSPRVVRCGCNRIMHVECYEALGSCPGAGCEAWPRPVSVLTPAMARRRNRVDTGASLRNLGLIFGVPMGAVFVLALLSGSKRGLLLMSGFPALLLALSVALGQWLRRGRGNEAEQASETPLSEGSDPA